MRTIKQLAAEAIEIQDACNPLGLSKGYARALQDLADALKADNEYTGGDQIRTHPINRLWLDKLCDLAHYQRENCDMGQFSVAYDQCRRLAGLEETAICPKCDNIAEHGHQCEPDNLTKYADAMNALDLPEDEPDWSGPAVPHTTKDGIEVTKFHCDLANSVFEDCTGIDRSSPEIQYCKDLNCPVHGRRNRGIDTFQQ
jgi:hypothetical protein